MWRTSRTDAPSAAGAAFAVALLAPLVGCRQDMHDQPRLEPFEESTFFEDGRGSRDPVEGTVARGQLGTDRHLHEGRLPGAAGTATPPLADTFPHEVTRAMLVRGRERYDIFCAPCHSRSGNGDGMIVRRGFRRPPAFTTDALRAATPGHVYDVVTRGFGAMPAYAEGIPVSDRWAIVAYVRALQLSQHATLADVPEDQRRVLESRRTP